MGQQKDKGGAQAPLSPMLATVDIRRCCSRKRSAAPAGASDYQATSTPKDKCQKKKLYKEHMGLPW